MHLSTMISVLISVVFGVSVEHIHTTKPYCAESSTVSKRRIVENIYRVESSKSSKYLLDHRNYLLRRIREGGGTYFVVVIIDGWWCGGGVCKKGDIGSLFNEEEDG